MFYTPAQGHPLPYDPFKALVAPRPIAWISTVDAAGVLNLAPYSFFNAVAGHPPQVMFASGGAAREGGSKDSVRNIRETGEFVINLVTWDLKEQMLKTAEDLPHGESEFDSAKLQPCPSQNVRPPGVQESPVRLECKRTQMVELLSEHPDRPNIAVFGEVVGVYIQDAMLQEGRVDAGRLDLIARMGYQDYSRITETFIL
ncbi:flavin reductase family protein [Kiritimatiellaeota bacterium B1221]|nr:flavin reductase family protein [Kiritimatiellaeota bacterium B1221]